VLPGRSLSDPGFEMPWEEGRATAPNPPGPPEEPDVRPAGGTWKDARVMDVPPAEGPEPHRPAPPEPLDPGTSVVPEPEEDEGE
jgi:hypothetical protein